MSLANSTVYDQRLKVLINGVEYETNITDGYTQIDSINISGGRSDPTLQPTPMVASVDIISNKTTQISIPINSTFKITTYDANTGLPSSNTSAYKTLFNGFVTDVTQAIETVGPTEILYRYTVAATTAMASLAGHRYNYSPGFFNNGDTVNTVLLYVLGNWDPTSTYTGVINADSTQLHDMGDGILISADLVNTAAQSARGIFQDRPDGLIYYNSYAGTTVTSFAGYDLNMINAPGISISKSVTNVYNAIHVTSPAGSDGTAGDVTSQNSFTYRYGTRDTYIQHLADRTAQATAFLALRKNPKLRPDRITLSLENPNITDAQRADLFATRTNTGMAFNLPTAMGGTLTTTVDNWAWSFGRGRGLLTLGVSLYSDTH
jgi:hypothetical protein